MLVVWLFMPWLPGQPKKRAIVLYGFSILGEVMNKSVFPAFQKHWKEHPDPLTSGGAQWAILAEYGEALHEGRDPQQELLGIWRNVVAQASSARAARTQYESGFGDALITWD